jgi:hypothetical protein
VIFATENSNKFQKNVVLERKNSIEDVVTLGPTNGTAHNSRNKKGVVYVKPTIAEIKRE